MSFETSWGSEPPSASNTTAPSRSSGTSGLLACAQCLGAALFECGCGLVDQRAQVLARRPVERGQHLMELHGHRRALERDRAAVPQLRRTRAAGRHVDEIAALEKQARADLEPRVGVHGAAVVAELEHQHLRRAGPRPHREDLADLDSGDAHGRPGDDLVGRLKHTVDAVALDERHALGEGEVGHCQQDGDRDDADHARAEAGVLGPHRASPGTGMRRPARSASSRTPAGGRVSSVVLDWLPGGLPIACPGAKGSLPASHSEWFSLG